MQQQPNVVPVKRFTGPDAVEWIGVHGLEHYTEAELAQAWRWTRRGVRTFFQHHPEFKRVDQRRSKKVKRPPRQRREVIPAARPEPVTAILQERIEPPSVAPVGASPKRIAPGLGLGLLAIGSAMIPLAVGINAQMGWRFGTTPESAVAFAGLSGLVDAATTVLPAAAMAAWLARRWITGTTMWLVWVVAFTAAALASVGFASVNLSDTSAARAAAVATFMARTESRDSAIKAARMAASTATSSRAGECQIRGPKCRELERLEQTRLSELNIAIALPLPPAPSIGDADPQVAGAVRLAAWVGASLTAADVGNLRLGIFGLLPNLAGLFLGFGWALRRRH
jgi:hypothetical protein